MDYMGGGHSFLLFAKESQTTFLEPRAGFPRNSKQAPLRLRGVCMLRSLAPESFLVRSLHKTLFACLLLVPLTAAAPLCRADDWKYEETHKDARDFVSGGMLHVHLGVGDLHVKRGDGDKLHLTYTIKSRRERNVKDAHVDFDVRGNDAVIEFHAPSGDNTEFDVELEVPANTNLDLHEKVGDLTVENVEGDKELDLGVGDIRIASEHASSEHAKYRLVHASAGIGDVNGGDYGETSGWLGKTLKYRGEGKYELRAHVGVGDIHLEGK
jgi:hypothetical protein